MRGKLALQGVVPFHVRTYKLLICRHDRSSNNISFVFTSFHWLAAREPSPCLLFFAVGLCLLLPGITTLEAA